MSQSQPWDDADTIEFVSLIAGQQSYSIEITQVREIRRWAPVTPLPHSDPAVLGVMNLRGAVIPIVDLSARLGLGAIDPSARHVIVVVAVEERTVGLLVDGVSEILTVKGDAIRETPTLQSGEGVRSIEGLLEVGDEMSRILDVTMLMPGAERAAA